MSTHGVRSHSKPLTDARPGAADSTLPLEFKTSGLGGDVLKIEEAMIERLPAQGEGATTCLVFRAGAVPERVTLADLPNLVSADDNFMWVDIAHADVQTVKQVGQALKLHEHAVEWTIAAWQPPRLDLFGNHFLVTTTLPQLDGATLHIEAQKVAFVVGHIFLMSIHQQPLPFISRVLQRATQNAYLIEYDAVLMLFILLDELLEYYAGSYDRNDATGTAKLAVNFPQLCGTLHAGVSRHAATAGGDNSVWCSTDHSAAANLVSSCSVLNRHRRILGLHSPRAPAR